MLKSLLLTASLLVPEADSVAMEPFTGGLGVMVMLVKFTWVAAVPQLVSVALDAASTNTRPHHVSKKKRKHIYATFSSRKN